MSLKARLILRVVVGMPVFAAILFVPAGTLRFWQGWTLMGLMFTPMFIFVAYFYKHDPELLKRRLEMKEKVGAQRVIMAFMMPVAVVAYLLPGFDYRFGWSRKWLGPEPLWLTVSAEVLFLAALLTAYRVVVVNRYASRTIEVAAGQPVISTGPYAVVRHPMYSAMLLSLLLAPLVLGSYVAVAAFALFIPIIVLRLLNEEKVLRQELPGYAEYCERTRYRLIPYLW